RVKERIVETEEIDDFRQIGSRSLRIQRALVRIQQLRHHFRPGIDDLPGKFRMIDRNAPVVHSGDGKVREAFAEGVFGEPEIARPEPAIAAVKFGETPPQTLPLHHPQVPPTPPPPPPSPPP